MPQPLLLALALAVPAALFLVQAVRQYPKVKEPTDFFFFGHSLSSQSLYFTLMASSLSLASAVIVFMDWGYFFGLGALWSPLLWGLGILVLWCWLPRIWPHVVNRDITLHSFLAHENGRSRRLRRAASLGTIVSLMGQFGVEILVGTLVLGGSLALTTQTAATLILLTGLVTIYTVMGGFRVVTETDKWQYRLVIFSTVALLVFLVGLVPGGSEEVLRRAASSLRQDVWPPASGAMIVVSLLCLNVFLLVTDMSVWQRVAALRDPATEARPATKTFLGGLLLFGVVISLGGIALRNAVGFQDLGDTPTLEFFSRIRGTTTFPLIAIGMFAAILSTADTFLIASGHALTIDMRYHRLYAEREYDHSRFSDVEKRGVLTFGRLGVAMLATVAVTICYGLYLLGIAILDQLFAIFAAQIALAPAVIGALFHPRISTERGSFWAIVLGYITSVILIVVQVVNPTATCAGVPLLYSSPIFVFVVAFLSWGACGLGPRR